MLHKLFGIADDRLLSDSASVRSELRFPSVLGIGHESLFVLMASSVKLASLPNSVGIGPLILL